MRVLVQQKAVAAAAVVVAADHLLHLRPQERLQQSGGLRSFKQVDAAAVAAAGC